MKKVYVKIGAAAILLLVIDQILKWAARIYLSQPLVITPWAALRYEQNFGVAWSIPIPYPLLVGLNIVLLFFLPWIIIRNVDIRNVKAQIALSFILGGALGNLTDRILRGYVIDYVSIGSWPVFNLADALLTTGIFLVILFYGKILRTNRT